ncbi:MAG: FtsW/RodA/SpoVE family cell cycle protein, partial [Prevotella sp.]|nr:FtsW/RodA/SpoVE family cell cycle protein [Prevotella sp.]
MKISNIFKGDKGIWMVFFFLCAISIVEVFSASSGLTYKKGNFIGPIVYHSGTIIAGLVIAVITMNIPCRYFKLMTPFLLGASFVTLLWVLFAGEDINGAQRVISVLGFTFQPSEIAKGTMVLAEAQILSAMQHESGADRKAFGFVMALAVPICFLIMLENLSTALLLAIVVFLMMFIGRVSYVQLGKLMGGVLAVAALGLMFIMLVGHTKSEEEAQAKTEVVDIHKTAGNADEASAEKKKDEGAMAKMFHRADTWKARIVKFLDNEEVAPKDYDLDKDAQVAHANIAIVSSNVIGQGPGNSVERDFLAQAFSDFIYAIIIEELGIIGAGFVVLLYIVLLFR